MEKGTELIYRCLYRPCQYLFPLEAMKEGINASMTDVFKM
jgi:hypothetical protein